MVTASIAPRFSSSTSPKPMLAACHISCTVAASSHGMPWPPYSDRTAASSAAVDEFLVDGGEPWRRADLTPFSSFAPPCRRRPVSGRGHCPRAWPLPPVPHRSCRRSRVHSRAGAATLPRPATSRSETHVGERGGVGHVISPACTMPRQVAKGDRVRYPRSIMTDTVLLKIDGARATITLNDPAKHNRLDTPGLGKLKAAIEKADADPHVRVTVLTGTGEKSFCSGYDLGSIEAGKDVKPPQGDHSFETVMDRLEAMRMPTLCALNGGVYGGATDMALACDFRLGVRGMRFFMPAARFGLHIIGRCAAIRRRVSRASPSCFPVVGGFPMGSAAGGLSRRLVDRADPRARSTRRRPSWQAWRRSRCQHEAHRAVPRPADILRICRHP